MKQLLKDLNFKDPTNLEFIKRLTTGTGILQHTKYAVPNRSEGYSSDDNARALILTVKDDQLFEKHQALNLAINYLAYLTHSKTSDNYFYTYQSFDHQFKEETSEDAFGRAVWALGFTIQVNPRWDITSGAEFLFNQIKANFLKITYPKAIAYTLLGCLYFQGSASKNDYIEEVCQKLADRIALLYEKNSSSNWAWFEEYLTYDNGLFPYVLFKCYRYFKKDYYLRIAVEALGFLESQSRIDNKPSPIGSSGFFKRGGKRALWDQQPIDACSLVLANAEAYRVLKRENYKQSALEWFSWFHGFNLKGANLFDKDNGGCFDGLGSEGVNQNQGAESTIAYWLAYLELVDLLKTN